MVYMEFVIAEKHSVHVGRIILEQEPQKESFNE